MSNELSEIGRKIEALANAAWNTALYAAAEECHKAACEFAPDTDAWACHMHDVGIILALKKGWTK